MTERTFTLIDVLREIEVPAAVEGDAVRIPADALAEATGWTLKPEGLCTDEVCVPVRDFAGLETEGGVDLATFARLLGRPLALDRPERTACLGASASERAARLATLEAPDFSLPDLEGKIHSLSDYRGRKVLLVAYASW
jgi:hypothetical protein